MNLPLGNPSFTSLSSFFFCLLLFEDNDFTREPAFFDVTKGTDTMENIKPRTKFAVFQESYFLHHVIHKVGPFELSVICKLMSEFYHSGDKVGLCVRAFKLHQR